MIAATDETATELTPLLRKILTEMGKEPGAHLLRPEVLGALAVRATVAAAAVVGNPLAGHHCTGCGCGTDAQSTPPERTIVTTTDKPASLLTNAIEKLRAAASAATPGPWNASAVENDPYIDAGNVRDGGYGAVAMTERDADKGGMADAEWIALLHPGVGQAVLDLLELHRDVIVARALADGGGDHAVDLGGELALTVARQILRVAN
ncbi:ead/Ea22-like family protein [Streptacidiphilus sp. PAMC 29251]